MRKDGRQENELRPIEMIPHFTDTKGGSVLICWGNTRVLCTALLEEGTMPFLKGTGQGWLTAEYAMLPSSTGNRKKRDFLKQDGRATEIQRLIGRSLRAGVDLMKLGERVIYVDCDVLQADGGTRTASITGAYVAVALGVQKWLREGRLEENPLIHRIAAVSVGIVNDTPNERGGRVHRGPGHGGGPRLLPGGARRAPVPGRGGDPHPHGQAASGGRQRYISVV